MTTTTYSMKNVVATINGREISDFWEGDDVITIEEGADIGTGVIGAKGEGIFSQAVNNSATITLQMQHTGPTHKLLTEFLKIQKARGALGTDFAFAVKDRASGEGATADCCFIMQAPSIQDGTNASQRTWVLWTANLARE